MPGPKESSSRAERPHSGQERQSSDPSSSEPQPTVDKPKTALFLPDSDEDKGHSPEEPFGQPSRLLHSRSSSRKEEDAGFEQPFLLLDPGADAETMPVPAEQVQLPIEQLACPSPAILDAEHIDDPSVPVKPADAKLPTPTEEWGTGDDEMDTVNDEIEPVIDEDVDEPMPPAADTVTSVEDSVTERCPICDAALSGMSSLVSVALFAQTSGTNNIIRRYRSMLTRA